MKKVFSLHAHFHANQTHFHMKSFARRLVFKQRQMTTRKWAIHLRVRMTVQPEKTVVQVIKSEGGAPSYIGGKSFDTSSVCVSCTNV